jgi:hypothetical protein
MSAGEGGPINEPNLAHWFSNRRWDIPAFDVDEIYGIWDSSFNIQVPTKMFQH